ncbi:substrate-binding domain-containing protein [Dongshaea marina]|uniref:substrate-binding domain-containing protein n=1 Tax=Dongshaea marina TaxID=2047966 RepID=UPI000D3E8D56|nr:substrate-binding domain-containing protein [Dongshaea marina]
MVTVPLAELLYTHFPDLQLRICDGTFEELSKKLLSHEVDFVLYDGQEINYVSHPERFVATPVLSYPLICVGSPNSPFLKQEDDLLKCPWALPYISTGYRRGLSDTLRNELKKNGAHRYEINNMLSCIELAKRGLAFTITTRMNVEQELKSGELIELEKPLTFFDDHQIALYRLRSRQLSDVCRRVLKAIESFAKFR